MPEICKRSASVSAKLADRDMRCKGAAEIVQAAACQAFTQRRDLSASVLHRKIGSRRKAGQRADLNIKRAGLRMAQRRQLRCQRRRAKIVKLLRASAGKAAKAQRYMRLAAVVRQQKSGQMPAQMPFGKVARLVAQGQPVGG